MEYSHCLLLVLIIWQCLMNEFVGKVSSENVTSNVNFEESLLRGPLDDATKNEVVSKINCYRRCSGANDLIRDKSIETSQSNSWAQHLGQIGQLVHSNSEYGENLYAGPDPVRGVDAWMSECGLMPSNPTIRRCGHYTQCLWKSSQKIGIGIAPIRTYGYVVVANFNPRGNDYGQPADSFGSYTSEACVRACTSPGGGDRPPGQRPENHLEIIL